MTFAFDLASVLRVEADARGLPASELAPYLDKALASSDNWGTAERALSARAAALFWHGRSDEAFAELAKPPRPAMSHAGYETITVLSLANRCIEFGQPEKARDSSWLGGFSLLEEATIQAMSVFDPQFRLERIALVNAYQQWLEQAAPNVDAALEALARITDYDTRLAYIDHLSARWSSPGERSLDGVKALIPLALTDATTLDALLARLVGPHLSRWSDEQVAEAVRVCAGGLTSSKPSR